MEKIKIQVGREIERMRKQIYKYRINRGFKIKRKTSEPKRTILVDNF